MPESDEVEPDAVTERVAPAADPVLLASVDVARAALLEITPADTVGELLGSLPHEDHVLSLHFATTMRGYPGWHWTVTLSRLDGDSEPNVLELELLPGDGAVLAPEWIPWSVRLADYRAAQTDSDEDDFDEDDADEDEDGLDEDDVGGDEDDLDDQVVVDGDDADDDDEDDEDSDDDDESGEDDSLEDDRFDDLSSPTSDSGTNESDEGSNRRLRRRRSSRR